MPPEVNVAGWNSSSLVPDNIKVKKSIQLTPLPLVLNGTLAWNLETKTFKYKTSCKDNILRGKVTLDIGTRSLHYRKRLAVPIGPLGKLGSLVLGAKLTLEDETHRVRPSYHVGFEFRRGGAEIVQLNTVRFKPKLFFGQLGVEACTDIGVQVPKQLFFELVGGELRPGSSKPEAGEEDAWGFNLDIKELNVVIRL